MNFDFQVRCIQDRIIALHHTKAMYEAAIFTSFSILVLSFIVIKYVSPYNLFFWFSMVAYCSSVLPLIQGFRGMRGAMIRIMFSLRELEVIKNIQEATGELGGSS